MKMVLLRVGIDSGCGGMQGPLFEDGSFEFLCIPDKKQIDKRTYGNTVGTKGRPHLHYFPEKRRSEMAQQSIHVDPEFETYTYGDPTRPKAALRKLTAEDMLVFYAGLQGFDFDSPPALYIVGFFNVAVAGMAADFPADVLRQTFGGNFHVRHPSIFARQRSDLVLVKGGPGSRLLKKAYCISIMDKDRSGHSLKVISPAMRKVFGDFHGKVSIQRSPPRWVDPDYVVSAASFVTSLP